MAAENPRNTQAGKCTAVPKRLRMWRCCAWLWVFAVSLAVTICLHAQQTSPVPDPTPAAIIHGLVASTDGAVYQGARVELSQTGSSVSQQTDADGAFSFTGVHSGAFKLTVSAQGFLTQSVSGTLQPGQSFDALTIELPVASAASNVTVSAESRVELAQEQLNFEEKQRVLGVFPNYYVSYNRDAVPLTSRQKFQLAWKMSIDPINWMMTGVVAASEQGANTLPGYGQGAQGYGKRFGAVYADNFTASMIGGALLPSLFKQDPRYFYKGTGSAGSRAGYAIANAFICKGDNGRWQPNYSGILGGIAAGGLSNLYYPASSRSSVDVTFENALIGTAEGAVQNLFQEFLVRHLTPHLHRNDEPLTP
jgi:hypothetical protein